VIPKWIAALIKGNPVYINGDGETSRDFCYIENVVQANVLAATFETISPHSQIYNIAVGEKTSLNELYHFLEKAMPKQKKKNLGGPIYRGFREGDILHSLADISTAKTLLGYAPSYKISQGLNEAMTWYLKDAS